jgi:hypothetical protein
MDLKIKAAYMTDVMPCNIGHGNGMEVVLSKINNIDEIAKAIAEHFDPGLLVTSQNQDRFLEAIGLEYIMKRFNLVEA